MRTELRPAHRQISPPVLGPPAAPNGTLWASGPLVARAPPLTVVSEHPLNAEASVAGLLPDRTPTPSFFVRSHFDVPVVPVPSWRLKVTGAVDRPRAWSFADLSTLATRRVVATLECAGNSRTSFATPAEGELRWGDGAVGTASWEGVPLRSVLDAAGILPGAREVVFTGADAGVAPVSPRARRFSRSLHLGVGEDLDQVLIATRMNGQPLTPHHGFPARLVVPGWYGMAWVKWLTTITVRRSTFRGHFQTTKYVYRLTARDADPEPVTRLRVKSLIVRPAAGARLAVARLARVEGKAWSGHGPVQRVEVDVGDGWTAAELTPAESPFSWSSWSYTWTPRRKGPLRLRSRAFDASGAVQPTDPEPNVHQYGANAVRDVAVEVG